jgi:3-hydroxybutyryl-CoA dehydrogenase
MKNEELTKIAIVGAGYMGGGMAQVFTMAGYQCVLADASSDIAQRSYDRLISESEAFEKQGLFAKGSTSLIATNLSIAQSIEDASSQADYIAEVVPETVEIKEAVLTRISASAKPDAIIATNTSAIPIAKLSNWVSNPVRFLGVHWMNPAPFVPGVELIASPNTSEEVILFVENLIGGVGKVTCRVSDVAGFIANRLQFALYREAVSMYEEGLATPEQVDTVVSNTFGFRLAFFGPFAIADMAGLDVYAGAYRSLSEAYGERFSAPKSLVEKVEAGEFGLKTGGGFVGLDIEKKEEIAAYRNRAYAALSKLKKELGTPPGMPD